MTFTRPRTRWVTATVVAAAMLFISAGSALAQSARLGATFTPAPASGQVHRFPGVAYDAYNDAYLVVWTHVGAIGARWVSGEGALLGVPTQVSTSAFARQAGAVGVSCATRINACLVSWIEESPFQIVGRLIRYGGGSVQFLTAPFVVANTLPLSSSAPDVAYSWGSNEFLVAWTGFGAGLEVMAQRVSAVGIPVGPQIIVAGSALAEFFPALAYNSAQNEFLVAYILNDTTVTAQRVQAGTGTLIGAPTPLYASPFEGYPEIAYDSWRNRYLVITWHTSSPWVIHGALADGGGNPLTGILTLASLSGGDGIGLSYSPITDSFLAVFQSQRNDEVWGAEITSGGVPWGAFQVTASGTRLAPQPMPAADLYRPRWLTVAPNAFLTVMGQFVGVGPVPTAIGGSGGGGTTPPPPTPTGCPSIQPAPNWVCVGGNWLPPTSSPGGGGNPNCPSIQPAADWVCVGGNWMPPTGGSGGGNPSCPSVQPGPTWLCVNGNWLPPAAGSGNPSCPSVQPAPDWVCANGNWLPGAGGGGGNASCPSIQPAPNWVCVNGNWLPGAGGGGGNASCPSIQPAPDWVCVSGNWLPGGGGGNASCPSIQPAPDWVCVSGNWLPGAGGGGNSSCPSIQPGPGWVCSNGNWLPGGSAALTGSCPSVQPAPDWLCSNGNWLPPTLACSSIQPGPGWTCQPSSGNWLPPGYGGDD